MVIKNIKNKYLILIIILLLILIGYILNNTISAYLYILNDKNILNNIHINSNKTAQYAEYNYKTDGKWLHHINNINDAKLFQDKSKAYELDVTFIDNALFISHDMSELNAGVTLQDYLAAFDNLNGRKFWFDLKNINTQNYKLFINLLNYAVENTNNGLLKKSDIIVEISDLEILKLVYNMIKHDNTRYNLSWYFTGIDLSDKNKAVSIINNYINQVDEYFFDYISSDIKYYKVIEKAFPNMKKLVWYTGGCIIERKYKRMLLYNYVSKNKNTAVTLYPLCK